MGLTRHGPRHLNSLEKAAVDSVFWAYSVQNEGKKNIFDQLCISMVDDLGPGRRGSYNNNHIKMSIRKFPCTDNMNRLSALGNREIFKPGNMDYLNTFIHEATHHWQAHNEYFPQFGEYEFTKNQLMIWDLDREGHASAAATWFILWWQIKYAYGDKVNLTTELPGHSVGTVDRYDEIQKIPQDERHGRWVPLMTAIELAKPFNRLVNILRDNVHEITN